VQKVYFKVLSCQAAINVPINYSFFITFIIMIVIEYYLKLTSLIDMPLIYAILNRFFIYSKCVCVYTLLVMIKPCNNNKKNEMAKRIHIH